MSQHIPEIHISDYTYELPEEKIAIYPLSVRDQSKLLIWQDGTISESVFTHIDQALPENSLLIFNNTRVIHARLYFRRETGARIEIFCLEPNLPADYQLSFQQTGMVEWKCLIGNAKKWKQGILSQKVIFENDTITLNAEMAGKSGNAFIIRFSWDKPVNFADIIEAAGNMPIPPYLNRPADETDNDRYQTMYAKIDGSVAAPTAGLHFTNEVLSRLQKKNITTSELTLHVGAGTFQPVKSEQVTDHEMHTETVVVNRLFIQHLLSHRNHIIAVGTTSVRSLESLYWLGVKINLIGPGEPLHVDQWEPYLTIQDMQVFDALNNVLNYMQANLIEQLAFTTSIIIVPVYCFRVINGMLTNFHQPQSTLLLLVGAFLGSDWKKVYDYALKNNFRFLSYGDSNLYLKTTGISFYR
jgi:S-adenosylmethionine:tRNA ribosyltransferase-isomerase